MRYDISPLDALLMAADTSFPLKKSHDCGLDSKENGPYSPSILRRKWRSPQQKSKPKTQRKKVNDLTPYKLNGESFFDSAFQKSCTVEKDCEGKSSTCDDVKLQQLATLSSAPLSGIVSLRGEEFCFSPTKVTHMSCVRQPQSRGDESPAKRRKPPDIERVAEEDIAESLLQMKSTHSVRLVNNTL